MQSPPIAAHRLLSDGHGTALLAHDGTIDWWCTPSFDAAPLLWSLLDGDGAASRWCGATFVVADGRPPGPSARTVVRIAGRRVELRDGLVACEAGTCLVRLARLQSGPPIQAVHQLALGGFDQPWAAVDDQDGFVVDGVPVALHTSAPLRNDGRWLLIDLELSTGEWRGFTLAVGSGLPEWSGSEDALLVLEGLDAEQEDRLRAARLPRHHQERGADALAVLAACTDSSTGAVVAAATTSLPEAIGYDRQFDYRYCWLRDAAIATSVAAQLGDTAAARRYLDFIAGVALPDPDRCPPVVRTNGEHVPPEREVAGVRGWRDSKPVRVGNAAGGQVQYDAWGFVLEAVLAHLHAGGRLDRTTWRLVRAIADRMAEADPEPEAGIWELRHPRPLLSADIGRWLVLDRAVRIARWHRPWHRRGSWLVARDQAAATVLGALGPDGRLPQAHDDQTPDASALTIVLYGLLRPSDPRAGALVDSVLEDLEEGAHVRRYPPGRDEFQGVDGAFLPISWWAVAALARLGRIDEARARADELCAGLPRLLAEMVDPVSGELLGNAPLVWSHMELARAMDALDQAQLERRIRRFGVLALRALRSLPGRCRIRGSRGTRGATAGRRH